MNIAELLEKLIIKKFYTNRGDIENKLNIFYAMSMISDTEYSNLVLKVKEVYEPVIEEPTEPIKEVKPVDETTEESEE